MPRSRLGLFALGAVLSFVAWAGVALTRSPGPRTVEEPSWVEDDSSPDVTPLVFDAPGPPTPAEVEEFGRFFAALGRAAERDDHASVAALFDRDRMVAEMVRLGAGPRPDREPWAGLGPAPILNPLLQWDMTRVRVVQRAAAGRDVIVTTAHRASIGGEEGDFRVRWWLVAGAGGWKVYDVEDLDLGTRLTRLAAVTPPTAHPSREKGLGTTLRVIRRALLAAARRAEGEARDVEEGLREIRWEPFSAPVAALRELAEAGVLLLRGNPAGALARLNEADRLQPRMPVVKVYRARALNRAGRYAEALDQARACVAEVGPYPPALTQVGLALDGLNRPAEAAVEFRRALDEGSEERGALAGLLRALPAGGKAEVGDRLAKTRDPASHYLDLIGEARQAGDDAGEAALVMGYYRTCPDNPSAVAEYVSWLVRGRKFSEAAALVRQRLAGGPPREPGLPEVLVAYLDAMLTAGQAPDALRAVPPAHAPDALRYLARDIVGRIEDVDPRTAERNPDVAQLAALVAARRAMAPGDPWAWYYKAAGDAALGRHEEAASGYAVGAAALERWDVPVAEHDRDAFRRGRIECLYAAKQGLRAYAEIGPAAEIYQSLAFRYAADQDLTGLMALTRAHAAKHPTDPTLSYYRGVAHFERAEYAAAARLFADYRARSDQPDEYLGHAVVDREVRARVRSGDTAGARQLLGDLLPPFDRNLPLRAVVAAAAGDAAGLERILGQDARERGGVALLYQDEDFARLIASPALAELRQRYPAPPPTVETPPFHFPVDP